MASEDHFPAPIVSYDVHVYYFQNSTKDVDSALRFRQSIMDAFPHLIFKQPWMKPVGPHPMAMFEVDIMTPRDFGLVVPWLALNHRHHSVLIHPLTGDDVNDHSHLALWLGDKVPIDLYHLGKKDDR